MQPYIIAGVILASFVAERAHAQYYPANYTQPYCREFTKVLQVGGRVQSAYGTACYQPDGAWQIVSDAIPASQPVQYVPTQNQVVYVSQPSPVSVYSVSFNTRRGGYYRPQHYPRGWGYYKPYRHGHHGYHGHSRRW